jgi:hypothetical protein
MEYRFTENHCIFTLFVIFSEAVLHFSWIPSMLLGKKYNNNLDQHWHMHSTSRIGYYNYTSNPSAYPNLTTIFDIKSGGQSVPHSTNKGTTNSLISE